MDERFCAVSLYCKLGNFKRLLQKKKSVVAATAQIRPLITIICVQNENHAKKCTEINMKRMRSWLITKMRKMYTIK